MEIEVYHATDARDVPESLFWALDGLDDRFLAAFVNYPDTSKIVVAAWATRGEMAGEPAAALIATAGHIITGYINEIPRPIPAGKCHAALLARLRSASKAAWVLVHDADEAESWIEQGFRRIDPPSGIPADQAVMVLAWGELPEDAHALLHARGLSWRRDIHRSQKA